MIIAILIGWLLGFLFTVLLCNVIFKDNEIIRNWKVNKQNSFIVFLIWPVGLFLIIMESTL